LRADVYDIIRYARDRDIGVHLCTNGVLLDSERVGRLRESGVNAISISVESPEPDEHELLRGTGTFAPAVEGIRRLRKEAPLIRVGINFLITTLNYRSMKAMLPFAQSLDVQQIKFAPIHTNLLHRRKRLEHYGNLLFAEEDLDALEREVQELARAASQTELSTVSQMFFSGISDLYGEPRRFQCYAGYAACAVNPSGIVSPCCDMDGELSVRDLPLENIWRSKEFHALRQRVRHCNSSCWDTTNTELSLRLKPIALLREVARTWHDVGFYFGRNKP
jgi:AdoMet-dependent heme synthase